MSDPVVANVIVGGATVWYAPEGEAKPDDTTVGYGAAWGGNWKRVGYTKAPVAVAYESSEMEVEVEEVTGPIDRLLTSETGRIETMLAEIAGEYIALATGQDPATAVTTTAAGASQVGFDEVGIGGTAFLEKFAWGFEGRRPDANGNVLPIRFFVHRATAQMNGTLEFSNKSGNYPGIPLQVKALIDDSQAVGQKLFQIQIMTAPAT